MQVAILVYPGVNALEVSGTHEVLARIPGARVRLVAAQEGPIETDVGPMRLLATLLRDAPRPDVLVVPGSRRAIGTVLADATVLDFVREAAPSARYVLAISEGALVLREVGLLQGSPVVDGPIRTASGVSGAIETTLHIAEEVARTKRAMAIQLALEYDPSPPYPFPDPDERLQPAALKEELRVGLVLYEGFTSLDLFGPYEVLSRLPGARISLLALRDEPVTNDTGVIRVVPNSTLNANHAFDLVLVPGSNFSFIHFMAERPLLTWLREVRPSARFVTSVCAGSMVLAGAGLIAGKCATGHWFPAPELERFGARPVAARWVDEGDVLTAAGVTAGIDMALALVGRIAGADTARTLQRELGYDPHPKYACGSLEKAPPEVVRAAVRLLVVNPDLPRALRTVHPWRALAFVARMLWRLLTRRGTWMRPPHRADTQL